jgi:hypothetical protein
MNQYLKAFVILTIFAGILGLLLYIFNIVHLEFREAKKEYIKGEKIKAVTGMLFPFGGKS